jgi:uncharacterized protein
VSGADYERLGALAEHVSGFVGNRCYMRMDEGHCAQLAVDHAGRFVCKVYETRPEVCRELERASPACEGELDRKANTATQSFVALRRRALQ